MSLPISVWAKVDQLAAQARDSIHTEPIAQPRVQALLCDCFDFLNTAQDHVELKLRVLALGRLVQSIQEERCSEPFSSGSQP